MKEGLKVSVQKSESTVRQVQVTIMVNHCESRVHVWGWELSLYAHFPLLDNTLRLGLKCVDSLICPCIKYWWIVFLPHHWNSNQDLRTNHIVVCKNMEKTMVACISHPINVVTGRELGHMVQWQSHEAQYQQNHQLEVDYKASNINVAAKRAQILKQGYVRHMVNPAGQRIYTISTVWDGHIRLVSPSISD